MWDLAFIPFNKHPYFIICPRADDCCRIGNWPLHIIISDTTDSAGFVAERIYETDKCEKGRRRTVQITQERQLSFLYWAKKAKRMELFNPNVMIRGLLWAASYCSIVLRPYLLHHHVIGIWKYLPHMKRCGEPRQHIGCCLTRTQLICN